MNKILVAAMAAGGMMVAGSAIAADDCTPVMTINALQQSGGATNPKTICFSDVDIDGDGLIAASEWDQFKADMFTKADEDQSGDVSVDEINRLQDRY